MIDAELLRSLGWSEDLIKATTDVAQTINHASIGTTVGSAMIAVTVHGEPGGSQRLEINRPPVAYSLLKIDVGR